MLRLDWRHAIAGLILAAALSCAPARAQSTPDACSATDKNVIDIAGTIPGRVALLVTNQEYPKEVGPLTATHKDGETLCRALVTLGFHVRHVKDANQDRFLQALRDYGHRLLKAGEAGAGFFYFAGHGAVPDVEGDSYLIPTEAPILDAGELLTAGIKLGEVVERISTIARYSGAKANFIVIDACRNVAFPRPTRGALGLKPVPEESGVLIAYSTAPGKTAVDNHHYSGALAKAMLEPNLPAYAAFREVRRRVLDATNYRQFPWMHDGLVHDFVFMIDASKPNAPLIVAPQRQPVVRKGNPVAQDCDVCPELAVLDPPPVVTRAAATPGTTPVKSSPELKPFAIAFRETTFDDWQRCVDDGGCRGLKPDDAGFGRGKRPVINVSWQDVQLYIEWLSRKSGKTFRLPTEAEWEYAARGNTQTAYGFGDDPLKLCVYANGGDFGRLPVGGYPCSDGTTWGTAEVGRYEANAFGLHDMHGNVWEWVNGCWDQGKAIIGSAESCDRVMRGGSWKSSADALKISTRRKASPGFASYTVGFRVARSIP